MKKIYKIRGMKCKSCVINIQNNIKNFDGITSLEIDLIKGLIQIDFEHGFDEEQFKNKLITLGYTFESTNKLNLTNVLKNIMLFFLILIIFIFIINFITSKGFDFDQGNMTLSAVFLIGIVASLSTCFAVVGGIVMSFGNLYFESSNSCKRGSICSIVRPNMLFHFGRLLSFFVLGGLLGLFGSYIKFSFGYTYLLTILLGVVMIYIGGYILNIFPNIFTLINTNLTNNSSQFLKKYKLNSPFALGVITFFLPCGFTQAMQLLALGSGSFMMGGLFMLVFGLGTFPVLFLVGLGSTISKKRNFKLLNSIIGMLILIFGLYTLNSGVILSGSPYYFDLNVFSTKEQSQIQTQLDQSGKNNQLQVIKMDVDYTFSPTKFTIKKGIKTRFEINGINIVSCSNQIVIPSLGITKDLVKGLNVIEFTPTKSGPITFSCGMGMLSGKITVE